MTWCCASVSGWLALWVALWVELCVELWVGVMDQHLQLQAGHSAAVTHVLDGLWGRARNRALAERGGRERVLTPEGGVCAGGWVGDAAGPAAVRAGHCRIP